MVVFLYPMFMDKIKLRTNMLEKRKNHSLDLQKKKSSLIIKQLTNTNAYQEANSIALYHAVRGEAKPESLRLNPDKYFYLPVLSNKNNEGLTFAPATRDSKYKNNQFNIPEPFCDAEDYFPAEDLDIVLMPLLGFDLQGKRLGMGGGYYDRCFSFKKNNETIINKSAYKTPLLIGYAYDFQEVENIREDPWDVALDAIVTESRFILF